MSVSSYPIINKNICQELRCNPCRSCGLVRSSDLPVTRDSLKSTVVSTQWNVESHDSLAGLDEVQVLLLDASLGGSFVVKELDLLKETRLVVGIELGAKLLLCCELSETNWARENGLGDDFRKSLHLDWKCVYVICFDLQLIVWI